MPTSIEAQFPNCPNNPSPTGCFCYSQGTDGYKIYCRSGYYSYTPENVKAALQYYKTYGPVISLYVYDIRQSYFSYVPDDFLVGNQMTNVTFECSHSTSVNNGLLSLSALAFTNGGTCGLAGNLTFTNCNLRQFYSGVLKNCNKLEKLAFMNSHVESLIDIPTLESLKNFTVYYPLQWTGASQQGLSRMTLASGASLSGLRYLDLSGNSLGNEMMEIVPQLTILEEVHLEGNGFSVIPDLTNAFYLHTYTMTLNSSSNVSILLPNPRSALRELYATFDSTYGSYTVMSLQGKQHFWIAKQIFRLDLLDKHI